MSLKGHVTLNNSMIFLNCRFMKIELDYLLKCNCMIKIKNLLRRKLSFTILPENINPVTVFTRLQPIFCYINSIHV